MAKKNYMSLAPESVFGTAPNTGWLGAAVEDLGGHEPLVATQQPKTMLYGQQGPSARGRRTAIVGGGGAIKPYLESAGPLLLLLLELTFGPPVVTELAEDEAWQRVYSSGGAAPAGSAASQVGREFKDGTQDRDTFVGGQVEKWSLSQGMASAASGVSDEGLVKTEWAMNYRTRVSHAERLPVYADPEVTYSGSDWTLSVGPDLDTLTADCLDSWGLEWNTNLDFEGAQCATSAIRDKAGPGGHPTGAMTGSWSYKDRGAYDAWLNGDILALRAKWEPVGIWLDGDETIHPSFTVDVPAFGMTGATPKESADGATKQDLPREILWDEENDLDMITVTVVSSDAPA